MWRWAVLVVGFTWFELATPLAADELRSLRDSMVGGAEETYPLIRCSGLFLSNLEWAGEEQLGQEAAQDTNLTIYRLMELATEMRTESLGEKSEGSVFRDVRKVSDLYLTRYEANYASTGTAWESDELWNGDIRICQELLGGEP